jgi:hypothetical protein
MGKLKDLPSALRTLATQAREERVAGMFGVDPQILREPPEDEEEAPEGYAHQEMVEAIHALESAIGAASGAQVKAIEGNVITIPPGATDKGIKAALSAHAKAMTMALGQVKEDPIIGRLVELIEENQRLQAALVEAMKPEKEEPEEPIEFTIRRNEDGFMTSVVAKPYTPPVKGKSKMVIN